ncbi:MAG: PhzF family phenazine biosynthesis protein [Peptoniphilus sp.]|nr:PhzF family phenazine biosynthesis protein [Peptoniphilus sp.]
MQYLNVYFMNVYAKNKLSGKTVAGIFNREEFGDVDMQKLSENLNQSTVAFVNKLDVDKFEARFYCGNKEEKFCGYATIGTFYTLAEKNYIIPIEEGVKNVSLKTERGKIEVELHYKDFEIDHVSLKFPKIEVNSEIPQDEFLKVLNISREDLRSDNIYTTENRDSQHKQVVIPLKKAEFVQNPKLITEEAEEYFQKMGYDSIEFLALRGENDVFRKWIYPTSQSDKIDNSEDVTDLSFYYLFNEGLVNEDKEFHLNGDYVFSLKKPEDGIVRLEARASIYLDGVLNI